jgi:hypothetical protein
VSSTGGSAKGVKMANQNPEPEDVEDEEDYTIDEDVEREQWDDLERQYLRPVRDEGGEILYWE